mgnify:CR=1 FL=1
MRKPKLSVYEQVEHLKEKGVLFNIDTPEKAIRYLSENNNFFKLTAFRKNYDKNRYGKYVNLEFAYLRDLAVIDMRIRKCLLNMCLDVEHNTRVRIIKAIQDLPEEDGYSVVADFTEAEGDAVASSYKDARNSPYCRDIVGKYEDEMPIWAFVEIQQFGGLCKLFKFIANRIGDKDMMIEYYMLQEIRKLRNACAHNNCIINDLRPSNDCKRKVNYGMMQALSSIGVSDGVRKRKMSNDRVRQITTLLYYYSRYINSAGLLEHQAEQLFETFIRRPNEHADYYVQADGIAEFFRFFEKIIDKWFLSAYNTSIVKKT